MGFVDESIIVGVDVPDAYSVWLDYGGYPRFMSGVERVEVIGYCRLRWTGLVCGRPSVWETDVVDRVEDTRLRWRAVDGREIGDVDFQKVDNHETLVHYQLEFDSARWSDRDPAAVRACLHGRVRDTLAAFKTLVEAAD